MIDLDTIRRMQDFTIPLDEFLMLMWLSTTEDGILYAPDLRSPLADTDDPLLCARMDWDYPRFEASVADLYTLLDTLEHLNDHYTELCEAYRNPEAPVPDEAEMQVFRTYGIPLDNGDFDLDRLKDIDRRADMVRLVLRMKMLRKKGILKDPSLLATIRENEGVTVTEEEHAYAAAYNAHLKAEAQKRLGERPMAYDLYYHGWRLWRMRGMGAPELILRMIEQALATAFMIYRHGTEPDIVTDYMDQDEA